MAVANLRRSTGVVHGQDVALADPESTVWSDCQLAALALEADASTVQRKLGDLQPVEVERDLVHRGVRLDHQLGSAADVVAINLVSDVQVVVLDAVRHMPVPRNVLVRPSRPAKFHVASTGPSPQGLMGLPTQRVLSGTDSPLITSDTGPTVA